MPNEQSDERAGACRNCGAALQGPYCHRCGQRRRERSVRAIAAAFLREITDTDGRLWRTVCMLFGKPGLLTALNVHGRRARYVKPVRMYLLASVLFFSSFQYTQDVRNAYMEKVGSSQTDQAEANAEKPGTALGTANGDAPSELTVTERLQRGFEVMEYAPGRFSPVFAQTFSTGLLLALPLIALVLYLLYRLPFYDHVVFALHYGTAFLLGFLAFMMLGVVVKAVLLSQPAWIDRLPDINVLLYVVFAGVCVAYLYAALRRAYRESSGRTAWKTAVVALASFISFILMQIGSSLVTAYRVGGMPLG